jgi:hypothetical protein
MAAARLCQQQAKPVASVADELSRRPSTWDAFTWQQCERLQEPPVRQARAGRALAAASTRGFGDR